MQSLLSSTSKTVGCSWSSQFQSCNRCCHSGSSSSNSRCFHQTSVSSWNPGCGPKVGVVSRHSRLTNWNNGTSSSWKPSCRSRGHSSGYPLFMSISDHPSSPRNVIPQSWCRWTCSCTIRCWSHRQMTGKIVEAWWRSSRSNVGARSCDGSMEV